MNSSTIISELRESICSGDVAVLCGAGISKESGLPVVNDLVSFILDKLNATKEEKLKIKKGRLPFEGFFDLIVAECNISQLLNIFRLGSPNINHIFLAKLVNLGLVKLICTTNFDTLIEEAFADIGLTANLDFKVMISNSDFDKTQLKVSKPLLIKLHGCISDEKQLAISIQNVANKVGLESRARIIKQLFSEGKHRVVLVLGYSCSDVFDIIPSISEISKNHKRVIFINHDENVENRAIIEDIRKQSSPNPFINFPNSSRIFCQTGWLINKLWWGCINKQLIYRHNQHVHWKREVEQWVTLSAQIDAGPISHNILGRLLYRVSELSLALNRYKIALTEARRVGRMDEAAHTLNLLGSCYGRLMKLEDSEECFLNALKEAEKLDIVNTQLSALYNLGILYIQLNEFRKSINCNLRSLELAKIINDTEQVLYVSNSLGVNYSRLGEYPSAIKHLTEGLEIATVQGDMDQKQGCLVNLGSVYRNMGNIKEALRLYELALEISVKLSDLRTQIITHVVIGNAHIEMGEYLDAQENFYEAKEISDQKGFEDISASCIEGLGRVHQHQNQYQEAMRSFEMALQIYKKHGDKKGQLNALNNIGSCFSKLGDFQLSLQCRRDALKIAKIIGNQKDIYMIHANIGGNLEDLGDKESALQYYKEAHTVLLPLLGAEHPYVKEIQKGIHTLTHS